jgi:hypothetical protein
MHPGCGTTLVTCRACPDPLVSRMRECQLAAAMAMDACTPHIVGVAG